MIPSLKLTIILTVVSAFGPFVFAGNNCEIGTLDALTGMSDRSAIIQFPDGRKITVVGHNHGDRHMTRKLVQARNEMWNSPAQLKSVVEKELKDSEQSLQQLRQDTRFLRELLANDPTVQFVGMEASQAAVRDYKDYYPKTSLFYDQLIIHSGLNQGRSEELKGLYGGAHIYLLNSEPQLFTNRALIGFESDDAIRAEAEVQPDYDRAKRKVLELSKDDPAIVTKAWSILKKVRSLRAEGTFDGPAIRKELPAVIDAHFRPEQKTAVNELIEVDLRLNEASIKRDYVSAKNLFSLKKSGVIFVGQNHLRTISNELKKLCVSLKEGSRHSFENTTGLR